MGRLYITMQTAVPPKLRAGGAPLDCPGNVGQARKRLRPAAALSPAEPGRSGTASNQQRSPPLLKSDSAKAALPGFHLAPALWKTAPRHTLSHCIYTQRIVSFFGQFVNTQFPPGAGRDRCGPEWAEHCPVRAGRKACALPRPGAPPAAAHSRFRCSRSSQSAKKKYSVPNTSAGTASTATPDQNCAATGMLETIT